MSFLPLAPALSEQPPSQKKDVLQLMVEAHEHLRSFTALAVQLGHAEDVPPPQLSETASRVVRYFTLGLPLHLEDEDYTLVPRLFSTPLSPALVQHLWELARQREELEQLVGRLVPLWTAMRDAPEQYAELAQRLAMGGRQLMKVVEGHLTLEEQHLFPLIRSRLPAEALVALATEILERRGQPC